MKIVATALVLLAWTITSAQVMRTYGVKINVTDMDKAVDFYCKKLGFQIESSLVDYTFLKSGDNNKLVLHKTTNLLPESDKESRAGLTLQVNDLDRAIADLKSKGLDFENAIKRKEGVGYAIYVKDPFGKNISLMHQTIVAVAPFDEPRIYNYGFLIPDMQKGIDFYSNALGFLQRSQKYLPTDMPLGHADNSFAFMLHFREGTEPIQHNSSDTEHVVIMFQTSDLDKAIAEMKSKGVKMLHKNPQPSKIGQYISFYDPFGGVCDLVEVK